MSLNTTLQNKRADDIATLFATGTLTIYSGAVPADANAALGAAVQLAAHTVAGFLTSVAGAAVANAIADDTIDATGTASFARLVAGGYTIQLTVGTSGAQVIVSSLSYVAAGNSVVNSMTLTQPAA